MSGMNNRNSALRVLRGIVVLCGQNWLLLTVARYSFPLGIACIKLDVSPQTYSEVVYWSGLEKENVRRRI